ncbi:hypothetical protein [Streptomyces sp. NPDC048309]|uniref:hypothetical protein n=1 Tax=unclassified Streptomyces TaxID=2593676 RepID=UPI0033E51496
MRRRTPGPAGWLALTAVAALLLGFTYAVGVFSGGHEIDETCAAAGWTYDERYRAEHWRDQRRLFPLHERCNAHDDLVPPWVNPALVVLFVALAGCAGAAGWTAITRVRAKRGKS